jgi:hypothetical protein
MLSSAERPSRPAKPPVHTSYQLLKYGERWNNPVDIVTVDQFPPRAGHAKMNARVRPASVLLGEASREDDRMKRIMREVRINTILERF